MKAHENPFRAECVEALPYHGGDAEQLAEQLMTQDGRGSLVGPKGSGKTTLLYELSEALRRRGFESRVVRLSSERRRPRWELLAGMNEQTALLLDGAEQLSPLAWLRVRWCARGVACFVTTSHTRPHLPLLRQHETSSELLGQLVGQLVDDPPGADELKSLYAKHNGNIRSCLAELYDERALRSRGG